LFHFASETWLGVIWPASFNRPSCSDSSCASVSLRLISASRICIAWLAASGRPNITRSFVYESTCARHACAAPFTPDRWLHQGDQVHVGDLVLDVYHCPGHTPGHVVFHHAPSNLALVGDVLFQGSVGRTDFPRGNHADLIRSITGRLWPLGDQTAFVPGHGPMSTFAAERRSNPYVADAVIGG